MRLLKRLSLLLMLGVLLLLALIIAYRFGAPPLSTPMLARKLTGAPVAYRWVAFEAMAPSLPRAVIGMEDARFCSHGGVDWRELNTVLNEEGGPSRGASTLTMQVARNLFLWQGGGTVISGARKGLEIPLALAIDALWPKRRVMEVYLNIAELGPEGQFGVGAGAAHAFGKAPLALSERESALLVAVLPNPLEFSARRPGPHAQRRAAIAQARGREVDDRCIFGD